MSILPLRFALREMRSGLRGFYVFIACIALGAMAIAGVGSLAASLADGLARQGRVILGGDLAFSLITRQASPQELDFLKSHGDVSSAATLRAMARTADGRATLVEIKAVDGAYPLFGEAELDPKQPLDAALAEHDGVYGTAIDPTLAERTLGVLQQEAKARNAMLVCSLHQVELARAYFPRIVGLRDGRIVFDAPREHVTDDMIAALYRDARDTNHQDGDAGQGDMSAPIPLARCF